MLVSKPTFIERSAFHNLKVSPTGYGQKKFPLKDSERTKITDKITVVQSNYFRLNTSVKYHFFSESICYKALM